MTLNKQSLYWKTNKEWYRVNESTGKYELLPNAPKEAVESFRMFCESRANKKNPYIK